MSANTVFLYGKITRRLFVIFLVFALLPVSVLSWVAIGRISEATDKQVSQVLEHEVKNYSYLILERLEFAEQALKLYHGDLSAMSAEALALEPASYLAQQGLIISVQALDFIENSALKFEFAGGEKEQRDTGGNVTTNGYIRFGIQLAFVF